MSDEPHTVPLSARSAANTLPKDMNDAALVGRVWRPGIGPSVVRINADGTVTDITTSFRTVSALCEHDDAAALLRSARGENIGKLSDILANTGTGGDRNPYLLSPLDLQAVKAAGVTFVESMIERVVEETIKGDPSQAEAKRAEIWAAIKQGWENIAGTPVQGANEQEQLKHLKAALMKLKPGSEIAVKLLEVLTRKREDGGAGLPSTYLTVGFGAEPEIFGKTEALMTVGHGVATGYNAESKWTNPEPEVVGIFNSKGAMVGAALGDDVNDRELEGRSPLLLNRAKNRNGTAAVGPFIRLFDDKFTHDDVRNMDVGLKVTGKDGFKFEGVSSMSRISRDPVEDLGQKLMERTYNTGAGLYFGTMTVPTTDRNGPGTGFTHKPGDIVEVYSDKLGSLTTVRVPAKEVVQGKEHDLQVLMDRLALRNVSLGQDRKVAYAGRS